MTYDSQTRCSAVTAATGRTPGSPHPLQCCHSPSHAPPSPEAGQGTRNSGYNNG